MSRRQDVDGTIYVLHFDPPFKHAKHYIGWTEGDVEARLATHLAGQGSRLVRAAVAAGCKVTLTHTEQGTRRRERAIKNLGNACRTCPTCRPAYLARMAALQRVRRAKRAA